MSVKQKLKNKILLWMKENKSKPKLVYERNPIPDAGSVRERREEMLRKYYHVLPRGF